MGNFEEEYKEEFFKENEDDLIKEFLENNKNEFDEFLKNEIIDDERDYEYWVEVFVKEVKEEEFYDYVNEEFFNNEDVKATERSIINDLYAGVFK